ncbi:NRT1/ PTR family 1.2-like protein [Tanacetum coccineum]
MSSGAGWYTPLDSCIQADQIDCKDNRKRERLLESFFGWYYASALMGVLIAFTGIVYIQDHHGWRVGFGIPVVLMLISTLSFIVAYPLYYKMKVEKSLFTSLCQLVLAAWKNRKVTLPDSSEGSWYYRNDTKVATPTKNLRFFNKACILTKPEDTNKDPWCNCTVEQVEELKVLIRVIPLWIDTSLKTLKYQQRHWDSSTSVKLRMGAGLVFSILAIEEKAIEEGFYNDSQAVVKMSAMWLVPQVFHGLSEALNIIGQMEFYYSESPKSMLSVATSRYLLGAVSEAYGQFNTKQRNAITKQDGKDDWAYGPVQNRTWLKVRNANKLGEEYAQRVRIIKFEQVLFGHLVLFNCTVNV